MFNGSPSNSAVERLNVVDDVEGATVRLIDRMACDLYEGLRNRQRCTACGGEGMVITRYQSKNGEEWEPDMDDILLSNICGCVKHTDALLQKYVDEHALLATLSNRELDDIEAAELRRYGNNG